MSKLAGRLHVLLLHFPIGLLLLALLLEAGREPRLHQRLPLVPGPVAGLALGLAAVSAFFASVCGWLLAAEGGYTGIIVTRHFYAGLLCAGLAIAAWMVQAASLASTASSLKRKATLLLLITANMAVVVAGHLGGTLTHGEDFLTHHAPSWVRQAIGLPAVQTATTNAQNIMDREIYAGAIQPILKQFCQECHNAQKAKADLRLDDYAEALKAVVPGKASESKIIQFIRLPLDDDDHMPPEGKPQLTEQHKSVLEWWVQTGAKDKAQIKELNPPVTILEVLRALE